MSTTNGFHPPPSITSTSSEISKRLPSTSSTSSTSSNSTNTTSTATRKHSKTKIILPTVNETRTIKGATTMKKKKKKKKKVLLESTRKRLPISNDSNNNNNNNNPRKKLKSSAQSPRHLLTHPILHPPKKHSNQLDPKIIHSSPSKSEQHIHHHHPQINHDHCDSCGEFYGEMISCDTCPATFHLLCANPPLSREDVPQGSYFCENCRAKTTDEKHIEAIDAKLSLQINGLKKQTARQSALEQMKLPTASNGRSLIQPSGEIKFRATNKTKSSSNFKRKRNQSPPAPCLAPVKSSNPQLDILRRLLVSCRPEEFRGPALPFDDPHFSRESSTQKNSSHWQTFCFNCRKSSTLHQRPSIHCDYCPLTYHLDCLTPPMTALPCSSDKWMCPNHIEPLLDRFLFDKNRFSTSERVKIYRQYAQIEHQNILQDFTRMRQTKSYLINKTNHQRLDRIEISHIPKVIEQAYANPPMIADEPVVQTCDSAVLDTLQAIITSISDEQPYSYSSEQSTNILEQIDRLLHSLNEPNYFQPIRHATTDGLATLIAAADALANDQIKPSLVNSHSLLIDLCQFRHSHAALIHLRSKHVIYLHKQVIWFGLSPSTDICLTQFNADQTCRYVSDRHACLYYDRSSNQFELLNYSEYGTIVNGLRYGLGNLSDDDESDDDIDQQRMENDNLQRCFCLAKPLYHSAWDGPAQLEQGTVVQIGCHEFLFYRHVVR